MLTGHCKGYIIGVDLHCKAHFKSARKDCFPQEIFKKKSLIPLNSSPNVLLWKICPLSDVLNLNLVEANFKFKKKCPDSFS